MFEAIQVAVYGFTVLLGFWVCLTQPRCFPFLLVLLLPTGNFIFEFGVTWTPWKVLLLIYWISLPAQYAMRKDIRKHFRLPAGVLLYVVAVSISTLLIYGFGRSSEVGDFVGFRDPSTRPIVQLLSICLRISVMVAVLAFIRSKDAVYLLLNSIIAGTTAVAFYGLYQFAGYYLGWPIMGISRAEQTLSGGYGLFNVHGIEFFRLGSYVGEPKEAAKFLLISTVLLIGIRILGIKGCSKWVTNYLVVTLHVAALILTFATSAFFSLAISVPFVAGLWFVIVKRVRIRSFVACTLGICLAIGLMVKLAGESLSKEVYEARVNARIGSIDSPEGAALQFLSDHPEYLATGVGLGNASFHLRPYFNPDFSHTLTVSLNSYYLELLVEGGIVGLTMLLVFVCSSMWRSFRTLSLLQTAELRSLLAVVMAASLTVAISAVFSSTEGTGQLWLFFGLMISTYRIAQSEGLRSRDIRAKLEVPVLQDAHSY